MMRKIALLSISVSVSWLPNCLLISVSTARLQFWEKCWFKDFKFSPKCQLDAVYERNHTGQTFVPIWTVFALGISETGLYVHTHTFTHARARTHNQAIPLSIPSAYVSIWPPLQRDCWTDWSRFDVALEVLIWVRGQTGEEKGKIRQERKGAFSPAVLLSSSRWPASCCRLYCYCRAHAPFTQKCVCVCVCRNIQPHWAICSSANWYAWQCFSNP